MEKLKYSEHRKKHIKELEKIRIQYKKNKKRILYLKANIEEIKKEK